MFCFCRILEANKYEGVMVKGPQSELFTPVQDTGVVDWVAQWFVYALSNGNRSYLTREDLHGMVMDIMHTHPGLEFCREATDFHDKYRDVVIARILWNLGSVWKETITAEHLRKSDLLERIRQLQEDFDINRCVRYFSYEHFYVVYCKFWEIDTNHDQVVSKADMRMHKDGVSAITDLVLDRIFSTAVRNTKGDMMNLTDFTYFLLAEEDKTHPTSLEYWFRVLDVDGVGVISMYVMEKFHEQVIAKLSEEGIDSMSFKDVACQVRWRILEENFAAERLRIEEHGSCGERAGSLGNIPVVVELKNELFAVSVAYCLHVHSW
ncbi:unnamed protein product [Heligmosomoides polygyrus]|uniref:EF-hand domain-containing protein n=1 Tax=Heligmosomoides polygyrus TaxID=6339 RepID=A0A3P8D9E3_HELPZ|nr:unnamed protein product [Heligmosomoides polygyrus]